MRILHLFDHSVPVQDGYSYRSLNILREQRRNGWETVQLTSAKHGPCTGAVEDVDGFRFYRTPEPTSPWARWPLFDQWAVVSSLAARALEVVRETHPDVLHAHSPPLNGLAALEAGKRAGLPVVYEVRAFWEDAAVDKGACREGDLRYRVTRALESHIFRRADAVTCICQGLYDDIAARGIAREKLTIIPNAVSVDQFPERGARDEALALELGLSAGRTIGFVGSFYAYEGLALLLEAAPLMLARMPELKILLVGGGAEEQRLHELARAKGLDHAVVFTGRVPHAEVNRYYDLIDCLVYPRLSMRITELVTPLKPLEAMAQRRLVVASDVGGHRELIEDGRTGYLFRAGDPADLARKVVAALEDPERAAAIIGAGREFVEHDRTWERSVARYREVYAACRAPDVPGQPRSSDA